MTQPTTKHELLAAIDRERDAWEALLAEIGEERMEQPGAMGEWTFKDLIAHLTAWRLANHVARFEAAARGETPTLAAAWTEDEHVDATNEQIYEENRDRPLPDILADSRDSIQRLADAIRAIPEPDLFDPHRYPWTAGDPLVPPDYTVSFGHLHDEHEPAIRTWLASLPAV